MITTSTSSPRNHLRLHVEEAASPPTSAVDPAWLGELRRGFAAATGWNLEWDQRPSDAARRGLNAAAGQPSPLGALHLGAVCEPGLSDESGSTIPRATLQPLVQAINHLVVQLGGTRHALRSREAELAAAIPVGQRRESGRALATRLEDLLRSATALLHLRAAGLYLLDDATSILKLRAAWGLPAERFCEPPRPLRGQLADLEALLGRTVTLSDLRETSTWNPPEPCAAAACVPVSTAALPLGTLWVFADEPRPFNLEQTTLLEIVAGRIAAELERDVLFREALQTQQVRRQWQGALQWQRARLPQIEPLCDDWQIAGAASSGGRLSGQFYDWEMLADGDLAVTIGRADGNALESSLTAAALHGAMKSLNATARDPRQLLTRLNETAWRSSAGDATSSLIHATICPESGDTRVAAAGQVGALIRNGGTVTRIRPAKSRLGQGPETHYSLKKYHLAPGDALVLVGGTLHRSGMNSTSAALKSESSSRTSDAKPTTTRSGSFPLSGEALSHILLGNVGTESAQALVDAIQTAVLDSDIPQSDDHAVLVLRRRATP